MMENFTVEQSGVSSEIQSMLNHIAGPKCSTADVVEATDNAYVRTTWLNSVMYAQDKEGLWHRVYTDTESQIVAMHVEE